MERSNCHFDALDSFCLRNQVLLETFSRLFSDRLRMTGQSQGASNMSADDRPVGDLPCLAHSLPGFGIFEAGQGGHKSRMEFSVCQHILVDSMQKGSVHSNWLGKSFSRVSLREWKIVDRIGRHAQGAG